MEQHDPAPVEVKNTDPMPVTVHDSNDTKEQSEAKRVAASAKVEANILRTDDQRRISAIWERTQQGIALIVVVATVGVASFKATFDALQDATRGVAAGPAFLFLVAASNLVIGFYFGRTNHQRVGGDTTSREDALGR